MKEELKSAIVSWRFVLAFFVMLTCFLGYSLPSWIFSADWGDEFREGALQLSVGGIFFGSSMLLLPFCSSVPHAITQVDEIQTGFLYWRMIRGDLKSYAMRKILTSMLSAGLATSLAFALHAMAWNIVAHPYDLIAHPYQEIPFKASCIYSQWANILYAFPIYLSMSLGIAFCASIWSVVALAIAVWMPDKLLTIIIPVCFYQLWSCRILYHLFGIDAPHPGALYNDALTVERLWKSIVIYSVVLLVAILFYISGLRRRSKNA